MASNAAAVPRSQKFNIGQYRGLVDTVQTVKDKVEREREDAQKREAGLREQLRERAAKGEKVQKELTIQLKCAGRSYQQLLDANRVLSEQIKDEIERREDEVAVLKRDVKERDIIIRDAAKPWKEEIAKRELKMLKLQENNKELKRRVKEEHEKIPPIISKYEDAIKGKENTIESVLLEVKGLNEHIEEIKEDHDKAMREQVVPYVAEIKELKGKLRVAEEGAEDMEASLKRDIKKLENRIVGLQKELDKVDHTPYEKKIDSLTDGFNRLRKDFEIKTQLNSENEAKMREGFENVISAMDKRLQEQDLEIERAVKPYIEEIEVKEKKIGDLQARIAEMRESEAEIRMKEAAIQEELRKEVKVCKEAVEMYLQQATKAKIELQQAREELEGDNGPWKKMKAMERRLDEVTLECAEMIKVKDTELKDKAAMIQRLQKKVLDDAKRFDEFADTWDKRIQEKEKGYNKAIAELAFAEGQIVEERKRTQIEREKVKARDRTIDRLKNEHTEELRIRMLDRQELEATIAELEVAIEVEAVKLAPVRAMYEAQLDAERRRCEEKVKDLLMEVARRERINEELEVKLQEIQVQFEKARADWEEKERELEGQIRARERTIMALKNELEFLNDNWEIKYARLLGLFEQLQKKYETTIGPNGTNEAFQRAKALKQENEKLVEEIHKLKETIQQQAKKIRDLKAELDQLMKETADLIAEKERGMAEMAGDMAKLENKYRDEQILRDRLLKQKDVERAALAESFQARVEQLEQLMEAMRFNDREELLAKIQLWKNNYSRVCTEREEIEESYKSLMERKEQQLQAMLTENDEERHKTEMAIEEGLEKVQENDKKWARLAQIWASDKETLEQHVEELEFEKEQLQIKLNRQLVLEGSRPKEDPAIAPLRAKIAELEEQLKIVEAGKKAIIEENAALSVQTTTVDSQIEDVHDIYKPQLEAKEREIKMMEKRHDELKEILALEMKRAQDTCRDIEEQVKRFPEPFEMEIQEMKDKYAQMQAGMQKIQMENLRLEQQNEETKAALEKEIVGLEKALDLAKHLLTEVATLDALKHLEKGEEAKLERMLGIDMNKDGRIG